MVKLLISKRAEKDTKAMNPIEVERVRDAVAKLADWPAAGGDIKKLQNREGYRLRVGQYRVLFHLENDENTLVIDRIRPRGEAYE